MINRIGIFSGTFDPVHEGHVSFVRKAREIAHLDKIIVIVDRVPSQKQPVASFKDRLVMTTMAFDSEGMVEVRGSTSEQTSFEDVNEFSDAQTHIIVGSDVIARMKHWRGITTWSSRMSVIVGLREGYDRETIISLTRSYGFNDSILVESPHLTAASSIARGKRELLPTIADYAIRRRLYA